MTNYTNIAKPSSTAYTNVNPSGKTQYDQSDILYDDPLMFYDGVDEGAYTNISKPATTTYTNISKPI